MKLLFVGQTSRGQTSGMRAGALSRLGFEVRTVDSGGLWNGAGRVQRLIQQQRGTGANITKHNAAVVAAIRDGAPDLMWMEKQEHIQPETVLEAQRRGILVVHYNPDPYFTIAWKRTAAADECLRLYDAVVVTKSYELDAYRSHAMGHVIYSPLGFDPVTHSPPPRGEELRSDVAFVGGWEPRREQLIAATAGITPDVRIWGYGWRESLKSRLDPVRALRLGRLTPGRRLYWARGRVALRALVQEGDRHSGEIYAEDYARVVGGARISLGFLRELCPDQHTTRTFEVPAMGGFLLADRTDEHRAFFEEGRDAEFFSSEDELCDKVRFYLANDSARAAIAKAGRHRSITSGYSYDERLRAVIDELRANGNCCGVPGTVR